LGLVCPSLYPSWWLETPLELTSGAMYEASSNRANPSAETVEASDIIATLAGEGDGVECCEDIVVAIVAGEAGSDCFWRLVI
jgi:hypothetical protein